MKFVLIISQGTTPLPGSDRWKALQEAEQKAIYADYAELGKTELHGEDWLQHEHDTPVWIKVERLTGRLLVLAPEVRAAETGCRQGYTD